MKLFCSGNHDKSASFLSLICSKLVSSGTLTSEGYDSIGSAVSMSELDDLSFLHGRRYLVGDR